QFEQPTFFVEREPAITSLADRRQLDQAYRISGRQVNTPPPNRARNDATNECQLVPHRKVGDLAAEVPHFDPSILESPHALRLHLQALALVRIENRSVERDQGVAAKLALQSLGSRFVLLRALCRRQHLLDLAPDRIAEC